MEKDAGLVNDKGVIDPKKAYDAAAKLFAYPPNETDISWEYVRIMFNHALWVFIGGFLALLSLLVPYYPLKLLLMAGGVLIAGIGYLVAIGIIGIYTDQLSKKWTRAITAGQLIPIIGPVIMEVFI